MLAKALQGAATAAEKIYIESVFSTFLYTGNGSTQTITNGIDLSGKGGLVWIKGRQTAFSHIFVDTTRGATKFLSSNNTTSEQTAPNTVPSFSSTGFTAGTDNQVNLSGDNFASWTFRKAEKFFDVVTYTGNGTAGRTVSHNLGSTPGCIILKEYSAGTGDAWYVWHRGFNSGDGHGFLNTTAAFSNATTPNIFGNGSSYVAPTSTNFTVGGSAGVNESGATYVAYLFAHDAGGFGDSGNDSVVKCGSLTGGGTVNLGWEPQWILLKGSGTSTDWYVVDAMRGMPVGGNDAWLNPNLSDAEGSNNVVEISSTGFSLPSAFWSSINGIYIAIRRGPMKTPTDATNSS